MKMGKFRGAGLKRTKSTNHLSPRGNSTIHFLSGMSILGWWGGGGGLIFKIMYP